MCRVCSSKENSLKKKKIPNSKPWITKRIKSIRNRKKLAFQNNGKEEYRSEHKELKEKTQKEKEQYKRKIETHFTYDNMRRVWSGVKLMSGYVNGNIEHLLSEYWR